MSLSNPDGHTRLARGRKASSVRPGRVVSSHGGERAGERAGLEEQRHKGLFLRRAFQHDGGDQFIHQGFNGRWAYTLKPDDVTEYEARAVQELGTECARWLATGEQAGS
jgi:hypothetical protein